MKLRPWSLGLAVGLLSLATEMESGAQAVPPSTPLATLPSAVYAWSPDGSLLAYAVDDTVIIVETTTFDGQRCRIRAPKTISVVRQVSWSPDGQQIAFVGARFGDQWDTIWVATDNCTGLRDLLPVGAPFDATGSRGIRISAWVSADAVAFAHHCGTSCELLHSVQVVPGSFATYCAGSAGVYHWDPTRSHVIVERFLGGLGLRRNPAAVPITTGGFPCSSRTEHEDVLEGCTVVEGRQRGEWRSFDAWSPDGRQVLFTARPCSTRMGSNHPVGVLSLWDVQTGRDEPLFAYGSRAAWAPDGSQIAFLLVGAPRYGPGGDVVGSDLAPTGPLAVHLAVMSIADRVVRILMPLGTVGPRGFIELDPDHSRPRWSPDSRRLLARDMQGNLFLVSADGRDRRQLALAADPAGQVVQPFTVGILRQDGILIPFAAFDGNTWTNAWPSATDNRPPLIPDGLANIPRSWWGREGPVTEWELIRPNGIRQWIRVTGVAPFQTHCLANVGLTTDFKGDADVRPHTYPVPSAGLTSTRPGLLKAVEEVPVGAPEFQAVSSLLPEIFSGLEKPAWSTVPETWRPSLSGSLPAPVLRALYRSSIGNGRERFWFYATRTVPTFISTDSRSFEAMTVVKGWLTRSSPGSGLAVEHATAIVDSDDLKGSKIVKPFGQVEIGGRHMWLGSSHGYEWETYVVVELDKGLLEANAGGC